MSRTLTEIIMEVVDLAYNNRKELADKADVSASELSRWASGQRGMPVDRLAAALMPFRYHRPEVVVEALRPLTELLEVDVVPRSRTAQRPRPVVHAALGLLQMVGGFLTRAHAAHEDGVEDEDELVQLERDLREIETLVVQERQQVRERLGDIALRRRRED